MRSNRLLAASLAAVGAAVALFLACPGLDRQVAGLFALGDGRFTGDTWLGRAARVVAEATPFIVLAAFCGLFALRRWRGGRGWAPSGAGLAVMALSLALGPGLLVNVLLKDHSHRPRPAYVTDFGGSQDYRPFYRFDGACRRNCSFVSGESAGAFWTLAPALLAPPPLRLPAIAGAIALGIATSLLRMAFGGHFLSDTVFAALFTWLVIVGCFRGVWWWTGRDPAESG